MRPATLAAPSPARTRRTVPSPTPATRPRVLQIAMRSSPSKSRAAQSFRTSPAHRARSTPPHGSPRQPAKNAAPQRRRPPAECVTRVAAAIPGTVAPPASRQHAAAARCEGFAGQAQSATALTRRQGCHVRGTYARPPTRHTSRRGVAHQILEETVADHGRTRPLPQVFGQRRRLSGGPET
jgi:hypothetical protein